LVAERISLILSLSKDACCRCRPPARRLALLFVAALLLAAAPAAAQDACYRPAELRADAEVKLAIFLEKAAFACSGVLQGPALEAWTEFHVVPDIVAGIARAEQARAPYYQRLYGGADWQQRWRRTEFAVAGYASEAMRAGHPEPAGCARLASEFVAFRTGGWPAYSAYVDRFLARMDPPARLCPQ
jgi:hypothetical protein